MKRDRPKSDAGRGRRAKAVLSPEEQALWEHAAQTMSPLRKAKGRVLARAKEPDDVDPSIAPKRRVIAESHTPLWPVGGEPTTIGRSRAVLTTELAAFDRKSARRLRSGQIEFTSRLDLHGMRQDEAHATLRRFLVSCQARGERWVLVITGKGAPRLGGDEVNRSEPGVLRRSVPMWIMEPELRAIVVSYTQAAISHGGSGAIYVQLRKAR